MIAKTAYDIHIKPSLATRQIQKAYRVPYVINDKRIAGNNYYIPNSQNCCNGVRTSPGWNIYPFTGNCETREHDGNVWDNNYRSLENGYYSVMFSNREVTFDFFNPSTNTFVPWTLYLEESQVYYYGRYYDGLVLKWKDANGNNPPHIAGIEDYIIDAPNRRRNGNWYDSIIVLFGFDGFAYNPFSDTDPIVAKLCIEASCYLQGTSTLSEHWSTSPKMVGCRHRNADSQNYRCMPYQFRWNPTLYPEMGYDIEDPVTAKAMAFGMTNWVRLHDDFKQYITEDYMETVPEYEYQKYLEFSDL